MKCLVLASTEDVAALWAYECLRRRDGYAWGIVTREMLTFALRWEHRVSTEAVSTRVELADGSVIDTENLSGVLNRLMLPAAAPGRYREAQDDAYAAQEFAALQTSWLHSVSRIMNPPAPQGLCAALDRRPGPHQARHTSATHNPALLIWWLGGIHLTGLT